MLYTFIVQLKLYKCIASGEKNILCGFTMKCDCCMYLTYGIKEEYWSVFNMADSLVENYVSVF